MGSLEGGVSDGKGIELVVGFFGLFRVGFFRG